MRRTPLRASRSWGRALRSAAAVLALAVSAAMPAAAADQPAAVRERTRETVLYGIDSEVLEVVKQLRVSSDPSFSAELARVLAEDRGTELRKAVLELFAETRAPDGSAAALAILREWQDQPSDLVIASVRYATAARLDGRTALLAPLLDAPQPALVSSAVDALGKTADPAAADLLLKRLADPDTGGQGRGEIIVALGDLGDRRAVEQLLAIAGNRDEDKPRRMYAADALGKMGDARAVPVLRTVFAERDALLKAHAAAAMSRLSPDEAFPLLLEGLKDENWRVRVECARGLARPLAGGQADEAFPVLSYKARLDPAQQVRVEAVKAMAAMGGGRGAQFLAGLFRDRKNPLGVREESLAAVLRSDPASILEAVRAVVAEEWSAVDQRTLEMTARVVSASGSGAMREPLARFLDSPNPIVRIYGVRGAASAGLRDLRERIRQMSEKDAHPAVQREAARAIEKL
jgi:HEAT repeat protein